MRYCGRIVGLDVAPGILASARAMLAANDLEAELIEADANDLRMFVDADFDRVMINYALHHFPDIDRSLHEACRVLKEDGLLLASTDSVTTMSELYNIHFRALSNLNWPPDLSKQTQKTRFSLEAGRSILERHFSRIVLHRYDDVLEFPSVAPFMQFYVTGTSCLGAAFEDPAKVSPMMLEAVQREVAGEAEKIIRQCGVLRITKHSGVFACSL
jgi:SAM-dependent methyltransferase